VRLQPQMEPTLNPGRGAALLNTDGWHRTGQANSPGPETQRPGKLPESPFFRHFVAGRLLIESITSCLPTIGTQSGQTS
jgi:hypothetical protein